MREKIVLIGAGSAVFTRGMVTDLVLRNWEAELCLVDIDPDALRVAEGLARKIIEARKAPVKLSATTDRRQALSGATCVICTIGVGGRRAWEADVFIPRKHGIYQPVGDTVMPGGTSRALRMAPAMVEIAIDVLDVCPQALFFNYANPMAVNCRAIRKATGASVIGLCHGVDGVTQYLAGELKLPAGALQVTAAGINHLTWFTQVRHEGRDLMPTLRAIARRKTLPPADDNPFSWRLLELFDAFPAVLDRHVCEFFPQFFRHGRYYGKTLGVDAFSFEKTIENGDRSYARMKEEATSDKPLSADYFQRIGGEHERALDILASIRSDDGAIYYANLPNRGQVPNLPEDAIVESPAVASGGTLRPLMLPPLSSGIAGTLATRFLWVETTVDAALQKSRRLFIQALILDGAVESIESATALADDLLSAHAPYLGKFGE